MRTTIQSLYADRCHLNQDGELVPMFWKPQALEDEPMCVYGDRSNPTPEPWQQVVKRAISLALGLEIEVGNYVIRGLAKELPGSSDPALVPLLRSNASDEARHYRGFLYAQERYGAAGNPEELVKAWGELANFQHPVAVAGILEAGVFLVSLGLIRVFGGPAMTKLSISVAEDEFRHVCTNYAVSKALGAWDVSKYLPLVESTLEWLLGGADDTSGTWTMVNLKRWSRELMVDQDSPEFDGLTWFSTHTPPFEVDNNYLYTYREA